MTLILLWPKLVSLTVTVMPFTLHMLQRLYMIIIILGKPNHFLDLQKDTKKNWYHYCLSMILQLEGLTITYHSEGTTPAALSVAQLLRFNRTKRTVYVRTYEERIHQWSYVCKAYKHNLVFYTVKSIHFDF